METEVLEIVSRSREETFQWGERLADLLKEGDVVALYGELGSGKTVFAQGVCAGLGVVDVVTSPSFILIQEYEGNVRVFHLDFYRLESEREVEDLDIDSYLEAGGVSIVEWADRGERFLPEGRISVILDRIMEKGRIVFGKRLVRLSGPHGRGLLGLKS